MKLNYKVLFFLLLLLLVMIAGCGGSRTPTKTILDVNQGVLDGSGEITTERSIVDSQGNVLFSKKLRSPGGPMSELFIHDNDFLGGYPGIREFIQAQGARTSLDRYPRDYYPVNIALLLGGNNLFSNEFWMQNQGLKTLVQREREHLELDVARTALNNREKEFSIEDRRLCIQGGNIVSNLVYYRSENSECYGRRSADCRPHFAEFPFFKSCSSLTNLRDTIRVPQDWENYSLSCNFNNRFSTFPSFLRNVNIGYSHCLVKNLDDSQDTILFGYGVGNPQIEGDISTLRPSVEDLFPNARIESQQLLSTNQVQVKNYSQIIRDLGKVRVIEHVRSDGSISITNSIWTQQALQEEALNESIENNLQLLTKPLIGTVHIGSYENIVNSNYLLLESSATATSDFSKYRVELDTGEVFTVFIDEYSSWFAVTTFDTTIEQIYNSYQNTGQLPTRTPERLLIQKKIDGREFTLIEESETLYFKSNNIFAPGNPYSTLPIYYLRITNVNSDTCQEIFSLYRIDTTGNLEPGQALSCRVENGVLRAQLHEGEFSRRYSLNNEIGMGYIVMRDILFPVIHNEKPSTSYDTGVNSNDHLNNYIDFINNMIDLIQGVIPQDNGNQDTSESSSSTQGGFDSIPDDPVLEIIGELYELKTGDMSASEAIELINFIIPDPSQGLTLTTDQDLALNELLRELESSSNPQSKEFLEFWEDLNPTIAVVRLD